MPGLRGSDSNVPVVILKKPSPINASRHAPRPRLAIRTRAPCQGARNGCSNYHFGFLLGADTLIFKTAKWDADKRRRKKMGASLREEISYTLKTSERIITIRFQGLKILRGFINLIPPINLGGLGHETSEVCRRKNPGGLPPEKPGGSAAGKTRGVCRRENPGGGRRQTKSALPGCFVASYAP